jgi:hypothetical protein
VPLTLMFRHLRDDAASLLGGGTAAFMRLGNHAEAEQAASYIGRRHTFAVSSFTATRGGSLTTTRGTSDSYSTGENKGTSRNRGWSDNPNGGLFSGNAHSGGRARTAGTSTSRTTGTNWSEADGTNWSDAEARQRVYEFAVEPTVLQNLPDYALLLADRTGRELRLRTVECDPDIITLPGATTDPLPPPSSIRPPADAYRYAGLGDPGAGPDGAMRPAGPAELDQPVPPALAGQYTGAQYAGDPHPDDAWDDAPLRRGPGRPLDPRQPPPAGGGPGGWPGARPPGREPRDPAGDEYERDERPWWQRNQPPEEQH